jgi:hypothetical protein
VAPANRKIFGLPLAASQPEGPAQAAARREAAAKIAANRTAIVGDLLKNSGIVRSRTNQYGNTLQVLIPISQSLHSEYIYINMRSGAS